MDSVEKRIDRLVDYYQTEEVIYWELKKLKEKPLNEENINNIVSITKARKDWLINGEGDPFLEHEEYLEKYIKTDEDIDWLINRKLFENEKTKDE